MSKNIRRQQNFATLKENKVTSYGFMGRLIHVNHFVILLKNLIVKSISSWIVDFILDFDESQNTN